MFHQYIHDQEAGTLQLHSQDVQLYRSSEVSISHIPQLTKKINNKQIRQKGNNKLQMVEVKGREGDHPKEREKKKETKDDKEVYFS